MEITTPGEKPEGVGISPTPEPEKEEPTIPTGVDQPRVGEVPAPMPDGGGSTPLPGGPLTQEENPSEVGLPPDSAVPEGPVLTDVPSTEPAEVTPPFETPPLEAPVIEPDQTLGATPSQEGVDQQKIDPNEHKTAEGLEGAIGGPLTKPATGVPIESAQTPAVGSIQAESGATETPVGLPEQAQEQVPPAPATEPGVADTARVSPVIGPEVSKDKKSPEQMRALVGSIKELLNRLKEEMKEGDEIVAHFGNKFRKIEDTKEEISTAVDKLEAFVAPEAKGGESD